MKNNINTLIILFLLTIFISLITPNVFSASNVNEINHFSDILEKDISKTNDNPTSFSLISNLSKTKSFKPDFNIDSSKKDFQILTQDASTRKGCQKAEKSNKMFLSYFSFF